MSNQLIMPTTIYGFKEENDTVIDDNVLKMFSVKKYISYFLNNEIQGIYYGIPIDIYPNGKLVSDKISKKKVETLYNYLDKDIYYDPSYVNVLHVENINEYIKHIPIQKLNIDIINYTKEIKMSGIAHIPHFGDSLYQIQKKIKEMCFEHYYIIDYMQFDNDSDIDTFYVDLSILTDESNFFYNWNNLIEIINTELNIYTELDELSSKIKELNN